MLELCAAEYVQFEGDDEMGIPKHPQRPTRKRDLLKFWRVFRSARTGEYVTRAYALKNPYTTVSERRWRKER